MKKITLVLAIVFSALAAVAQPVADTVARREDDIISLEDLMKAKVTVASQNEQTLRETPGVVTIITAKEIRSMGARDLIDVLRMVPGLDFAHDIDGVIGMGIRGNWAQEAKVMLMVDGMDMTEVSYGSQQFSSHYPLDIIERIEIIRGPGSTIYGGNASLAVINIITRDAKKVNGVGAVVNYGQMKNSLGRLNATINAGREFDNGLALVGSFSYGTANMSDRIVDVPNSGTVNYGDSSKLGQMMAVFNLKYKGLTAKYLFDNYTLQSSLINNTYLFRTHMANISYDWKIGKKVTITPRVSLKSQLPWFYK
jgi:outer membrane cobalamin receptor